MHSTDLINKMRNLYLQVFLLKLHSDKIFYEMIHQNNIDLSDKKEILKLSNVYPLSIFTLDNNMIELYESLMFHACHDTSTAITFYNNKLYLEKDKDKLYQSIIISYDNNLSYLKADLVFKNQEDLDTYIINSLNSYETICQLFTYYDSYLNDKILNHVSKLLKIEDRYNRINLLIKLSEKYQTILFNSIFTEADYLSLYTTLQNHMIYSPIRDICFTYLINRYDSLSIWQDLNTFSYSYLTPEEKDAFYNKYHESLFTYNSFHDYVYNCQVFNNYINDQEKDTLIRHASTKTRYHKLKWLMNKINFNDEQLARIKSIICMYEIKH